MTAASEHPDRRATTLADRAPPAADAPAAGDAPGDARVDLRLLWHAVDRALADRGTTAARQWLAGLDTPDLRAGTIQDGTARGLRARLEEALSLCDPAAPEPAPDPDGEPPPLTGRDLRRKRDILVSSGGVRVRFSRKQGVHLIDRHRDLNIPHFLQFDDQADAGCLDRFVAAENAALRRFSPAFLSPEQLVQGPVEDRLVLTGRLGRRHHGFDCRIILIGRKDEPGIRMRIAIHNRLHDHRLRVRFVGAPEDGLVFHRGTPAFQPIGSERYGFLAATLVRACGRLRVGDHFVATPDAQLHGWIEHVFGLGMTV